MQNTYLQVKKSLTLIPQHSELLLGSLYRPSRHWEDEEEEKDEETDQILDRLEDLVTTCQKSYPYVVMAKYNLGKKDPPICSIKRNLPRTKHKALNKIFSKQAHNYKVTEDDEYFEKVDPENKEYEILPTNDQELLSICVPSTFGDLKNNETKIDTKVRMAYEIPGAHVKLSKFTKDFLDKIRPVVSSTLFSGKPIRFEINKVNVYPVGGFFTKHVDTPRKGVIGTLVLQLVSEFYGGELVIQEKGAKCRFGNYWNSLAAIAFYGNCPHEILPVTEGCRKTISMYILEDENTKKLQDDHVDFSIVQELEETIDITRYYVTESNVLGKTLAFENLGKKLVDYYEQNEKKKNLGFLLSHKYSVDEFLGEKLKGADAEIFSTLKTIAHTFNLEIKVVPVLIYHAEHGYMPEESPIADSFSQNVYRFGAEDIERVCQEAKEREEEEEGPTSKKAKKYWKKESEKPTMDGPVVFLGAENWTTLDSNSISYCEFTGNECQPGEIDNYYFTNAVILENKVIETKTKTKTKGKAKSKAKTKGRPKKVYLDEMETDKDEIL